MTEKECFGEKCRGCKEFFSCEEHWGGLSEDEPNIGEGEL